MKWVKGVARSQRYPRGPRKNKKEEELVPHEWKLKLSFLIEARSIKQRSIEDEQRINQNRRKMFTQLREEKRREK